ncbi:MAG: hypothetical protein AAF566_05250 [Pseudomonadota bacterium]
MRNLVVPNITALERKLGDSKIKMLLLAETAANPGRPHPYGQIFEPAIRFLASPCPPGVIGRCKV